MLVLHFIRSIYTLKRICEEKIPDLEVVGYGTVESFKKDHSGCTPQQLGVSWQKRRKTESSTEFDEAYFVLRGDKHNNVWKCHEITETVMSEIGDDGKINIIKNQPEKVMSRRVEHCADKLSDLMKGLKHESDMQIKILELTSRNGLGSTTTPGEAAAEVRIDGDSDEEETSGANRVQDRRKSFGASDQMTTLIQEGQSLIAKMVNLDDITPAMMSSHIAKYASRVKSCRGALDFGNVTEGENSLKQFKCFKSLVETWRKYNYQAPVKKWAKQMLTDFQASNAFPAIVAAMGPELHKVKSELTIRDESTGNAQNDADFKKACTLINIGSIVSVFPSSQDYTNVIYDCTEIIFNKACEEMATKMTPPVQDHVVEDCLVQTSQTLGLIGGIELLPSDVLTSISVVKALFDCAAMDNEYTLEKPIAAYKTNSDTHSPFQFT